MNTEGMVFTILEWAKHTRMRMHVWYVHRHELLLEALGTPTFHKEKEKRREEKRREERRGDGHGGTCVRDFSIDSSTPEIPFKFRVISSFTAEKSEKQRQTFLRQQQRREEQRGSSFVFILLLLTVIHRLIDWLIDWLISQV